MCSLLANLYTVNKFRLSLRVAFQIGVGSRLSFEMEVRLEVAFRLAVLTDLSWLAGTTEEISTMVMRFQRTTKPKTSNGNHSQDWETYNLIQTNEKSLFPQILRMLCEFVVEPLATGPGRPKAKYADQAFCVVIKAFECDSARRYTADLRIATERKLLGHVP